MAVSCKDDTAKEQRLAADRTESQVDVRKCGSNGRTSGSDRRSQSLGSGMRQSLSSYIGNREYKRLGRIKQQINRGIDDGPHHVKRASARTNSHEIGDRVKSHVVCARSMPGCVKKSWKCMT